MPLGLLKIHKFNENEHIKWGILVSAVSVFSQQHKEKEIKSLLEFERRKRVVDQAVSRLLIHEEFGKWLFKNNHKIYNF